MALSAVVYAYLWLYSTDADRQGQWIRVGGSHGLPWTRGTEGLNAVGTRTDKMQHVCGRVSLSTDNPAALAQRARPARGPVDRQTRCTLFLPPRYSVPEPLPAVFLRFLLVGRGHGGEHFSGKVAEPALYLRFKKKKNN